MFVYPQLEYSTWHSPIPYPNLHQKCSQLLDRSSGQLVFAKSHIALVSIVAKSLISENSRHERNLWANHALGHINAIFVVGQTWKRWFSLLLPIAQIFLKTKRSIWMLHCAKTNSPQCPKLFILLSIHWSCKHTYSPSHICNLNIIWFWMLPRRSHQNDHIRFQSPSKFVRGIHDISRATCTKWEKIGIKNPRPSAEHFYSTESGRVCAAIWSQIVEERSKHIHLILIFSMFLRAYFL